MDNQKKPEYIVPDSVDREFHFKQFGYYVDGIKYWVYDVKIIKGDTKNIPILISNFTGKFNFHLVNGTNNSKRILTIQKYTGEIYTIEIESSEMRPEAFKTILHSKQMGFLGNGYQLERIFMHWMDNETQANIIDTLGWNREFQLYAFANAVIDRKGNLLKVNEVGIIQEHGKNEKYYLPAFGLAHINNPDYEGERKFVFIEGDLNFEQWAKLYFEAFESNGAIAILFLILSVFWDIVFNQVGFFPFLFLFGAFGTGKTTLVEFLLRLLGKDFIGIPLNNATQVALSRTIASRNNSIFYLKEYTTETDEANQDLILTAYDGSGRSTGVKSNDNRTKNANVKSAIIFDGNQLPTQKAAVLSRMILLNFENNKFTDIQRKAFNQLEKNQDIGFGKILIDILKHRQYFQDNFKKSYDENIKELREIRNIDFAERTLKHVALILAPAKMLVKKLQFPFNFNQITISVVENAIEQNRLLKSSDEVTIFWQAFSYGVRNNTLVQFSHDSNSNNKKNSHFNLKSDEKSKEDILQIKLQSLYPEYVKYCKNNGQRFLDGNSLRMLLTAKSNPYFIPGMQKGRGETYTDKFFGSCYQFHPEKNENGFLINGVEINM